MRKLHPVLFGFIALGGFTAPVGGGERTDFPPQARQRYERARELLEKGQYREAIEAYEEAMRQGMKDYPRAHLGRARSTLLLKEYDAAIERYTHFIEKIGLENSCRH